MATTLFELSETVIDSISPFHHLQGKEERAFCGVLRLAMKSGSTTTTSSGKSYGLIQESHPHRHQSAVFIAIKSYRAFGGVSKGLCTTSF